MKKTTRKTNKSKKQNQGKSKKPPVKQFFYSRRLLSLSRTVKYGINSFFRNSWLSVAATLVMTLTLSIILVTFLSHQILNDTISNLQDKVDMSIYLKTETTDEIASVITNDLKKLESVKKVTYISADQARKQIIEESSGSDAVLEALKEATNQNPATLRVVIEDINDTTELEKFVESNKTIQKHLNNRYKPSFAGERRQTIKSIGRSVGFVQKLGLVAGALFVLISALIIFNTIRMAIFNRKEEIYMMKLIGADKSFISGPFLVEAVLYGVLAAILATGLCFWALHSVSGVLTDYQIVVRPTLGGLNQYWGFVLLGVMVIGSLVGIISSSLATKQFLKQQQ